MYSSTDLLGFTTFEKTTTPSNTSWTFAAPEDARLPPGARLPTESSSGDQPAGALSYKVSNGCLHGRTFPSRTMLWPCSFPFFPLPSPESIGGKLKVISGADVSIFRIVPIVPPEIDDNTPGRTIRYLPFLLVPFLETSAPERDPKSGPADNSTAAWPC